MITESTFVGCDGLPFVMRSRLDQPWHFVGEVKQHVHHGRPLLRCMCKKCEPQHKWFHGTDDKPTLEADRIWIVDMDGFKFITDDMIEVMVYFGVCEKCDAGHWARTGPPFRRVHSLVDAFS